MPKAAAFSIGALMYACTCGALGAEFHIPLFISAADDLRQGFIRIINHSEEAGTVSVRAIDDVGAEKEPREITLNARQTLHFNSDDLELGNPMDNPGKVPGLEVGIGGGTGSWRLVLDTELDIEPLVYVRTNDGFLTSMHDLVPGASTGHEVAIFNPGRNPNQISKLRLINPGTANVEVQINGVNDAGGAPENAPVTLTLPAGEVREFTSKQLEDGDAGFAGSFGYLEAGRWRLMVSADGDIQIMSLLESPTGHLTNLSTRTYEDLAPSERAAFDRLMAGSGE